MAPSSFVVSNTSNHGDLQLWCVPGYETNRVYSTFDVHLWGGVNETYKVLLDGVTLAQGNYSDYTVVSVKSTVIEGHLQVLNAGEILDCGLMKFQGKGLTKPDEEDTLGDIISFFPTEIASLKLRVVISIGGMAMMGGLGGAIFGRLNKPKVIKEGPNVLWD